MLLLCLTGLPLIFHDEIDHLLEGERVLPPVPAGRAPKSLDDAVAAAVAAYPGERPLYMSFDEHQPVVNVTTGPGADAAARQMNITPIDRRTAVIIGKLDDGGFMHVILRLHVDMFAGLPGELFLGFMGFLMFAAIVSGVVVYVPFMRRLPFGTVRTERSRRLQWLDLHNMLGIVTLLWLSVVGLTGVINTLSTPLVAYWRFDQLAQMIAPTRASRCRNASPRSMRPWRRRWRPRPAPGRSSSPSPACASAATTTTPSGCAGRRRRPSGC